MFSLRKAYFYLNRAGPSGMRISLSVFFLSDLMVMLLTHLFFLSRIKKDAHPL